MIITTSNPKRSGENSKITFVICDTLQRVTVEIKCSNIKRQVKKDPELLKEITDVAMFSNTLYHDNPMMRLFRECKARVDVHRYFNNMSPSVWGQTQVTK